MIIWFLHAVPSSPSSIAFRKPSSKTKESTVPNTLSVLFRRSASSFPFPKPSQLRVIFRSFPDGASFSSIQWLPFLPLLFLDTVWHPHCNDLCLLGAQYQNRISAICPEAAILPSCSFIPTGLTCSRYYFFLSEQPY